MEIPITQLPPGDPRIIDIIVGHLKSRGIFDRFRKECLADVDTKPAFLNLRQRVDGQVKKFLDTKTWRNDLNKNQLRDAVRKNIQESGILDTGIDAIINQVVNPKIKPIILPLVEDTVYGYLQIEKPKREIQDFENLMQPVEHGQKPFYAYETPIPQPYPPYPVYQEIPRPLIACDDVKDEPAPKSFPKVEVSSCSVNNDQESSVASESEVSLDEKLTEEKSMDEVKPNPAPLILPSDILPMETDVISSGEDDILARGSPESASSTSHITVKDVAKMEDEDNAVDSFDTARGETDTVTSGVEQLSLKDEKPKITEEKSDAQDSKDASMTCLPLFDNQSLDSISSNTSGLSFSPKSATKTSLGETFPLQGVDKPLGENFADKSGEDLQSGQSTPLVDEKSSSQQGSPSPEISQMWTPYTLPKDLTSTEKGPGAATFGSLGATPDSSQPPKVVEGASPVSAEDSQGSLGVSSSDKDMVIEAPRKVPKSDKSEGEITSTSSSSPTSSSPASLSQEQPPKSSVSQVRSFDKETFSDRRSSKSENHPSRTTYSDANRRERRRSKEKDRRSKSRSDDHSSHHDRNRHHRRDRDDDRDKDRHGKGHSSTSGHSHRTNTEGSARDKKDKGSERSSSDNKSHSKSHSISHSKSHSNSHSGSHCNSHSGSHSKQHSSSSHSKSHSSSKNVHSNSDSRRHRHKSKGLNRSENREENQRRPREEKIERGKEEKVHRTVSDELIEEETKFEKELQMTTDFKRENKMSPPDKTSPSIKKLKPEVNPQSDKTPPSDQKLKPDTLSNTSSKTKEKSSQDNRVKPVKTPALKEDSVFGLHLSNDKKDAVLPKPTTFLNKMTEKKLVKENTENKVTTTERKVSGFESKKEVAKPNSSSKVGSINDKLTNKDNYSEDKMNSPLKFKISLNRTPKVIKKMCEKEKSTVEKYKNDPQPALASSDSSLDESSDEIFPLLKKVTIPIFSMGNIDAKEMPKEAIRPVTPAPKVGFKRKREGAKAISRSFIESSDDSEFLNFSDARELFEDSSNVESDFEGFANSEVPWSPKKSKLQNRSHIKRLKKTPSNSTKPLRKHQVVVVCDDSSSSDMEMSVVDFCKRPEKTAASSTIDFEGFKDKGLEEFCSGPDQKLRDYLSQFSSFIRLNDFINCESDDYECDDEAVESTVFSLSKNTTKSVIEEIAEQHQTSQPDTSYLMDKWGNSKPFTVESFVNRNNAPSVTSHNLKDKNENDLLKSDSIEALLPLREVSGTEPCESNIKSVMEGLNASERIETSLSSLTVTINALNTSDIDLRKPIKKRKLSGLSSDSLSSSSSSPKIKRKCAHSPDDKTIPSEDFAAKNLLINSYSILTPEEDRSSSKDYEVDLGQREAAYVPLSPASDSSSEEIKTKLINETPGP